MEKLDHLGWVVSSSFAIGDARFAVRSTSHAFGAWLSDVLGAYEVEDAEEYLYSVVVPDLPTGNKVKGFFILYKGSSAIMRTSDPSTIGRGFLTELEGHRLRELSNAVYVMASVAQVRGESVVIPTSFAPGLAKLGRRAAKLDIVVPGQLAIGIDLESSSVVPIDTTLSVGSDALDKLQRAFPWDGHDGVRFLSGSEGARALLVPSADPEATARPVSKGIALAHLAGWTLNLERAGGNGLRALGRFVEQTPCFETGRTDAADAITNLADAIQEAS